MKSVQVNTVHIKNNAESKYFSFSFHISVIFNPFNAVVNFCPKHKDANVFENHLNPVMLLFIG